MSFWKYSLTLSVCSLLAVGCGGGGGAGDRPDLVPVKGKVQFEGQPVPNAQVEFVPDQGGPSSAQTGADGTFTLTYRDGEPGAVVGTHRVTVTAGGPTPEQQAALEASAEGDRSVKVPTDIAPYVTYTASATVKDGENDLVVEVTRSAGGGAAPRNSAER